MKKVTISDVAKRAGVSTATVSYVINNSRSVSDETANAVFRAIEELNYTPDMLAKSFRTGKKQMIGFIMPDISNRFYATIVECVEEIALQQGYRLVIANTKENPDREMEQIRYLSNGMVDGLIVASTMKSSQELKAAIPKGLPVVLIDRTFPDTYWDSVIISNYQSVYNATLSLQERGHKKIGYIAGIPHISTSVDRLQGYRDAMAQAELPVEEGFVQFGDSMEKSARLCVAKLLELGCTALIASNGIMSIDTIYYCDMNHIHIPKDLDLVCFNEYPAIMHTPDIGYIYQPVAEMGRCVATQILARINEMTSPIKEVVLLSTFLDASHPPLSAL